MYRFFVRPFLKLFPPRKASRMALRLLEFICKVPVLRLTVSSSLSHPTFKRSFFGMDFKNPVGIASGVDPTGRYFDEFSHLGASYVEIGPISLSNDKGNTPVRAIIDNIRENAPRNRAVIAADICKSPGTPQSKIADEIDRVYTLLYDFVDIAIINLKGIRSEIFTEIIDRVTTIRRFNDEHRPILFKLSPEMSVEDMDTAIHLILSYGLDGIVIKGNANKLEILHHVIDQSHNLLPVIVSGGIGTVADANKLLDNGAAMISVGSFLPNGPHFVKRILRSLVPKPNKK